MEDKEIEEILKNEYKLSIKGDNFNNLYNIIAIKKKYPKYKNFSQSIYKDVKMFVSLYTKCIEDYDYGYDMLQEDKVLSTISELDNVDQELQLLCYTKRKLSSLYIDTEWIDSKIIETQKRSKNFIWRFLYYFSHYYKTTIILFFLLFFATLHDAANENWVIYETNMQTFSNNNELNIFLNEIVWLLGIDDCDVSIKPINIWGIFVQILFCSGIILPIGTKIINDMMDKLNFN